MGKFKIASTEERECFEKQGFFYGWIVAAACFTMVFVSLGLGNSPGGLYITPVTEELDFSRGAFSIIISLRFISTAAFNIFLGFLVKRLEVRKMIGIGFGLLAISYFVFSRSQNLMFFYLSGIILGIGLAFSSTAVVSILIERWFIERKGMIMGIVLAGSGLGGALFNTIVAGWIERYGWNQSYFFTGVCLMVFAIPVLAVIRNNPDEMGFVPYGSEKKQLTNSKREEWKGFTLEESLKKPYFYLTGLCVFFIGFLNSPVYIAAPSHMIDRGLDVKFAATAMSLFFLSLAVAKVVMGLLYDRFGLKTALVICFASHIIGTLLLAFVQNKLTAILFAIIFGFSVQIETVSIPLMIFELFGSKTYIAIIGIFLAMSTMGIAISNPIMNFSYDLMGSYQGILLLYVVLSFVILTLLLYIMRAARTDQGRNLKGREEKGREEYETN
jgi:MFS family permease